MTEQPDWYQQCFYRVGVYGLIRNDKEEVLLVNEHGKFTLPGGGWDYGETMKEALSRELFEEIALTSPFEQTIRAITPLYNENKQAWQLCIICEIHCDQLDFGIGEHAEDVRWSSIEDVINDPFSGKLAGSILSEYTKNDPVPISIEKGTYRHSKTGKLYEVVGIALETETNEQVVIYHPLYDSDYELFSRPHSMFTERVEIDGKKVPRFVKEPS